jgi:hypothetical protein
MSRKSEYTYGAKMFKYSIESLENIWEKVEKEMKSKWNVLLRWNILEV